MLARIRASQGQAAASATLIASAVKAAGDTDYLPSYYQAMLLLRGEGQHAPTITPDAARQALALLARVTTLEPSLADAHGLAAYAALAAGDPKAAMASAATAFRLSQQHEYALITPAPASSCATRRSGPPSTRWSRAARATGSAAKRRSC